jgi:glycosyltransferase involved in cell wall biosynthesis
VSTLHAAPVFINGRFLSQPVSGVQRYAREIVLALDARLKAGQSGRHVRYTLLAPPNASLNLDLKAIEARKIGPFTGHVWEQTTLAWAARGGALLSMGNSGPLLHRRQLVVIFDAAVFRHPENFSANYVRAHRFLGRSLARTARIATISEFSRRELAQVLGLAKDKIVVAPCGSQHLMKVTPEPVLLEEFDVAKTPFFMTIGLSPNKNLATIVAALNRIENKDVRLAVIGGGDARVFGREIAHDDPRVVFLGRQSDEVVAGLLGRATALIFAGIYEGFGIPPLEGLAYGCPVIASDIPAVREVCADTVDYFPPLDAAALAAQMERHLRGIPDREQRILSGKARAASFDWAISAAILEASIP